MRSIFALLSVSLFHFTSAVPRFRHPPNIVLILFDDVGWANVGFHRSDNSPEVNTPNLDYLATKEGLRLERFYTHYTCSPARTSLLSGRLPIHVGLENLQPQDKSQGVPLNMTVISEKIKSSDLAFYQTHFVGKWDAGMASPRGIPAKRGFDSSLLYFGHMNDFWTKQALTNPATPSCTFEWGTNFTDLWEDEQPAYQLGSQLTYEDRMFADRVHQIIKDEAKRQRRNRCVDARIGDAECRPSRFFLMFGSHIAHFPLQIPKSDMIYDFDDDQYECNQYTSHPTSPTDRNLIKCRSAFAAQMTFIDGLVGDITDQLHSAGLWDDTLVVITTDNGGSIVVNTSAGNNYPLKGGKFSPLEGGIRVPAVVTGGYLPKHQRGKVSEDLFHIADWYATLSSMVGVDPTDERAAEYNLPPIDSIDLSSIIMRGSMKMRESRQGSSMLDGENDEGGQMEENEDDEMIGDDNKDEELIFYKHNRREMIIVDMWTVIKKEWKLTYHPRIPVAVWQSLIYPNATTAQQNIQGTFQNCVLGCLFNLFDDPSEHDNVFEQYPSVVQELTNELYLARQSAYQNHDNTPTVCPFYVSDEDCMCWAAEHKWGGFIGPYLQN